MKNVHFIFLIIFTVFFSCKTAPESAADTTNLQGENLSTFLSKTNKTLVSAHRGGSGLQGYPENSLETIEHLYAKDIKIFEIDVFQSVDDQIMLLHDDFLDRTTNGFGSIKGMNANELTAYNLVDDFGNITPYKIPLLDDVLKWGHGKEVYFMLDFKRSASYEKVIALIRKHQIENQCILIGYNVEQIEKLHKLAPEMQLSVPARNEQELDWVLATGIPTHKMIAFTGTKLSGEHLFQRLKDLQIPAILGTLGNLDKKAAAKGDELYQQWADIGIQIIATDRPIHAQKALQ